MKAPVPDRRLSWPVAGDMVASLARLADELERGRLDAVDTIRSAWMLRSLIEHGSAAERFVGSDLLRRLEAGRTFPPPPNIRALRCWVAILTRQQPPGSLGTLARTAGVTSQTLSRFRSGAGMTDENRERLSAALIVAGLMDPNRNTKRRQPGPRTNQGKRP